MEPKRWDIDEDAQPYPNQTDGDYYRVDDPAIVLERRIAAWAASNNLLDENGEPRKIIGTLPVTADGCVVGHGVTLHYPEEPFEASLVHECGNVFFEDLFVSSEGEAEGGWHDTNLCYSTREAACEAAESKENSDG